jgi:hypothetical protein
VVVARVFVALVPWFQVLPMFGCNCWEVVFLVLLELLSCWEVEEEEVKGKRSCVNKRQGYR